MSAAREAIALITAGEDQALVADLWRTSEARPEDVIGELARMARASMCAYAVLAGVDPESLLQAFGLGMAHA